MNRKKLFSEINYALNSIDYTDKERKEIKKALKKIKEELGYYKFIKHEFIELKLEHSYLKEMNKDLNKTNLELSNFFKSLDSNTNYLNYIKKIYEIDPIVILKAIFNGFYYIKNNEIYFQRNGILVGTSFITTKPVYAVKEVTLESCYYGTDTEEIKYVKDAHYWSWKTLPSFKLRDYKKTWALNKEDLEDKLIKNL